MCPYFTISFCVCFLVRENLTQKASYTPIRHVIHIIKLLKLVMFLEKQDEMNSQNIEKMKEFAPQSQVIAPVHLEPIVIP